MRFSMPMMLGSTGVDGTGVKVGVISDGYDGLATAVGTGDSAGGGNDVRYVVGRRGCLHGGDHP